MDDDGEEPVAVGAEKARGAAVLRPLVQAYLKGIGSPESGFNDAVWELGVSRSTVWRWIKRLTQEGAASRLSVALCLTQAVAPKADLLAELACDIPWPAQGEPQSIHVDNGRDFRSRVFRSAFEKWGIDLIYRSPGRPHC